MALHNMESYEEDGTLKLRLRLSGPLGTVQGSAEMTPAVTELARTGLPLTKVTIVAGGEQDWLLGSPADPVVVRGVQWISASPEGKSS